jgi:hypothetical protein
MHSVSPRQSAFEFSLRQSASEDILRQSVLEVRRRRSAVPSVGSEKSVSNPNPRRVISHTAHP